MELKETNANAYIVLDSLVGAVADEVLNSLDVADEACPVQGSERALVRKIKKYIQDIIIFKHVVVFKEHFFGTTQVLHEFCYTQAISFISLFSEQPVAVIQYVEQL